MCLPIIMIVCRISSNPDGTQDDAIIYMKNKRNLSICMVILPGHTVVVEFNASLQSVIRTTGKHNF